MDKQLIIAVLILHDVLATLLLVAVTIQAVAAWNGRDLARTFPRLTPYMGDGLQNIVAGLILAVVGLGAVLYPSYRLTVKPYLETHDMRASNGAFEIKEHFAALMEMMLRAYWVSWKTLARGESRTARLVLTTLLCAMVWWNFTVGHVMNSIAGLFS